MKIVILVLSYLSIPVLAHSQNIETVFQVHFKDKAIGTLHVIEQRDGDHSIRDLRTVTDTKIIAISVHVESEVKLIYKDGELQQGTSYRHANRGPADIHAHINKADTKVYEREKNGTKSIIKDEITHCVVDLFFSEPKDVSRVFSNMHAEFLSIRQVKPGMYHVATPDGNDSFYTYSAGSLVMVETDTPLGKVVSRRVKA